MTPKEIAETIIKTDESEGDYLVDTEITYKVPLLADAYLALESRIQKLEAVAEAARDLQDSAYYSGYFDLDKALAELVQP